MTMLVIVLLFLRHVSIDRHLRLGHVGEEKEFRLEPNGCGFICVGANFVSGYKRHALFYFTCL